MKLAATWARQAAGQIVDAARSRSTVKLEAMVMQRLEVLFREAQLETAQRCLRLLIDVKNNQPRLQSIAVQRCIDRLADLTLDIAAASGAPIVNA